MAINQYLLQWNQHLENFAENFNALRDQAQYCDCTLACEDGIINAHRIVLAGCSSYLQELFSRTSSQHPIIFLTNTNRSVVLLLLEFIYRGKAYVPQEKMADLLSLGRQLRIKGLIRINTPSVDSLSPSSNNVPVNFSLTQSSNNSMPNCSSASPTDNVNVTAPQTVQNETVDCNANKEIAQASVKEEYPSLNTECEDNSTVNGEVNQYDEYELPTSPLPRKKRGRPKVNRFSKLRNTHMRGQQFRVGPTYCLSSSDMLALGGYSKKFGAQEAIKFAKIKYKRNFRLATIQRYEGLYNVSAENKQKKIDDELIAYYEEEFLKEGSVKVEPSEDSNQVNKKLKI